MQPHNFWPNKSYIVIDTETTGLDFKEDEIIQCAVSVFKKGENIHNFNWYSNTTRQSHPEALKVHKITDEFRQQVGIPPREIIDHVSEFFRMCRESGTPVLAYNAPFDFSMLRTEFLRQERTFYTEGLYIIDPIVIDRHYQKHIPVFQAPWMRLYKTAQRYGVKPPSHNAIDDAITTGLVAFQQSLHYPFIRKSYPKEIHEKEYIWHHDWVFKVMEFSRRKHFEFKTPDWPFGDTCLSLKDSSQELSVKQS